VRSPIVSAQVYTITFSGLPAGTVTTTTPNLAVAGGATASFSIEVDGSALPAGWNFGQVTLTPDNAVQPVLHMPIAIRR
jgi:hypothetical protein